MIADLPYRLRGHTQDGSLVCGGTECLSWNPELGVWNEGTATLTEVRTGHISWTPADGTMTFLMGGLEADNSSEIIEHEKEIFVSESFPMKHRTE